MVRAETVIVQDSLRSGMPTVLLLLGHKPMESLLAFFREKCFSISAERAYAHAAGKFIEWLSVRAVDFTEVGHRSIVYTAFAHDLQFGTYRDGKDVYGLNWKATSQANLQRLLGCLIKFSDWLVMRYGSTMLNPLEQNASYGDQIICWRRWNNQKTGSLLAHIKNSHRALSNAATIRRFAPPRSRNALSQDVKAFPVEHVDSLLWKGFINPGAENDPRPWIKYNLRDILITMLCLYGGCRESEPLHLWIEDVFVDPLDPTTALVLIHEPFEGMVDFVDPMTGVKKKTTRADFLHRFCGGRKPLTLETGRRHAGWKGSLLTHRERRAFQVFWIDKNAGRAFLTLWKMYLQHVRPVVPWMPWAFLTKATQPLGAIGFSDSFTAAVRRIGLKPSKWSGTSTHGLRHRYGQWLNHLGLGEKEGQVAMHHRNAKSQEVYRQLGVDRIAAAFSNTEVTSLPQQLLEGTL